MVNKIDVVVYGAIAVIVGIVGYELYRGLQAAGGDLQKTLSNLNPLGNLKLPNLSLNLGSLKLPSFSAPSAGAGSSSSSSLIKTSNNEQSAKQAFLTQVAPYISSKNGIMTSINNFSPFTSTLISPYASAGIEPVAPNNTAQYNAVENALIQAGKNVRPEYATPSAGNLFSGQDQGYGYVFNGQPVLLFNKTQQG